MQEQVFFCCVNPIKHNLCFVSLPLLESPFWRRGIYKEPSCKRWEKSLQEQGRHYWNQPPLLPLSSKPLLCSSPGKQMDQMAGSGFLWLPAQSPGLSKAPPSTWPMTSDLGPVANTGGGARGKGWGREESRYQAAWAQATHERVGCFHSSWLTCAVLGAAELVFLQILPAHVAV